MDEPVSPPRAQIGGAIYNGASIGTIEGCIFEANSAGIVSLASARGMEESTEMATANG